MVVVVVVVVVVVEEGIQRPRHPLQVLVDYCFYQCVKVHENAKFYCIFAPVAVKCLF